MDSNGFNEDYLKLLRGDLIQLTATSYLWRGGGEKGYIECHPDGRIQIMECDTQNELSWQAHDKIVTDVKQLNKNHFVTCSKDGKVKLWMIKTDNMVQVGEVQGQGPGFSCLEVSEDGNILMAGDAGGGVFFFSIL